MRITTKMLNDSAMKAGLPIMTNSLLNMGETDNNTLLSALSRNKKAGSIGDLFGKTKNRADIEKLSKDAEAVKARASAFLDKGEKGLMAKTKESGDNSELVKAASELAEKAGNLYSALTKSGGVLNSMYASELKNLFSENKETLSSIGISMKDGKINIDREKLGAADAETFEKTLGNGSVFSKELSILAAHVSDNAEAGIESFGSNYSSKGVLSEFQRGRYDFFS